MAHEEVPHYVAVWATEKVWREGTGEHFNIRLRNPEYILKVTFIATVHGNGWALDKVKWWICIICNTLWLSTHGQTEVFLTILTEKIYKVAYFELSKLHIIKNATLNTFVFFAKQAYTVYWTVMVMRGCIGAWLDILVHLIITRHTIAFM